MCFLNLPQKIFFYFVVFDQFNVLLLMIMLLYCHKIEEYINKDDSFQQCSHLSKKRRAELIWVLQYLLHARKGGLKKQSPRVLQFLIKGTTIYRSWNELQKVKLITSIVASFFRRYIALNIFNFLKLYIIAVFFNTFPEL